MKKDDRQVNLYECSTMFAETMKEKFGARHDGAIFMAATDGEKFTQLISGSDQNLHNMLCNMLVDDEVFELVAGAMVALGRLETSEVNGKDHEDDDD